MASLTSGDSFFKGVKDIIMYILLLVFYTIVIETETISTASPLASKMKDEVLGDGFDEILTVDDNRRLPFFLLW